MNMTRIKYVVCIHSGNLVMAFTRNCVPKNERLFKVGRLTGSHVHRKSGSIKEVVHEMVQDRHVVITHH